MPNAEGASAWGNIPIVRSSEDYQEWLCLMRLHMELMYMTRQHKSIHLLPIATDWMDFSSCSGWQSDGLIAFATVWPIQLVCPKGAGSRLFSTQHISRLVIEKGRAVGSFSEP
jgi:hypothetical protein